MTPTDRSAPHGSWAIAWLATGILLAAAFASGLLPPLWATVATFGILTVVALSFLRVAELSIMSRLFVLLYTLPFSATLGYLFDADYVWANGGNREPLCQNHELMNQMLLIAVVGFCGMMAGIEFMASRLRNAASVGSLSNTDRRTLRVPVFVGLLAVALILSWLHAPIKTIFEAAYDSAGAGAKRDVRIGLNGAYLVSYLILSLLYVDLEQESTGNRRRFKRISFWAVIAYIVVALQFLRGDRECAGLVAALAMLHITKPATHAGSFRFLNLSNRWNRALKIAIPVGVCVAAFIVLGAIRTMAREPSLEHGPDKHIVEFTWTAVALNNMGLAADYHYGSIEYLHGRTYLDYLLSLPPRALMLQLGIPRPMDGPANPSTWYRCLMAMGGMHPAIVPFRNFGIWGVFPVLFVCGAFISYCEIRNERGTFASRLLYGCIATTSMLWFWFGDLNLIRSLMTWGVLVYLYRLGSVHRSRIDQSVISPGQVSSSPLEDPLCDTTSNRSSTSVHNGSRRSTIKAPYSVTSIQSRNGCKNS